MLVQNVSGTSLLCSQFILAHKYIWHLVKRTIHGGGFDDRLHPSGSPSVRICCCHRPLFDPILYYRYCNEHWTLLLTFLYCTLHSHVKVVQRHQYLIINVPLLLPLSMYQYLFYSQPNYDGKMGLRIYADKMTFGLKLIQKISFPTLQYIGTICVVRKFLLSLMRVNS